MKSARANFAHVVVDNLVYVIGGISGQGKGKKAHYPKLAEPGIERYDPVQNSWTPIEIANVP